MLQFTFEKNNLLCKKREKNNLSREKISDPPAPPPPGYQMVCPSVKKEYEDVLRCKEPNVGIYNLFLFFVKKFGDRL